MRRGTSFLLLVLVLTSLSIVAVGQDAGGSWVEIDGPRDLVLRDLAELESGGFAVSGSDGRGYLALIDQAGGVLERDIPDGDDGSVLYGVASTGGDTVVAVGKEGGGSRVNTGSPWAVSLDGDGSLRWSETYAYEHGGALYDVVAREDGGVLAVGEEAWDGGLILAIGPDGEREWDRVYGGEEFFSVIQGEDGFVVAGRGSRDHGRISQAWAIAVDANGNIQWERRFERPLTRFRDVTRTERGYLFAGTNGTLVELDENGSILARQELSAVNGTIAAVASGGPDQRIVCDNRGHRGAILRYGANWTLERTKDSGHIGRPMGGCRDVLALSNSRFAVAGTIDHRYAIYHVGWFHVTDQQPPDPVATVDPHHGEVGQTTFRFDSSGSTDNTGVQYYRWDFDGDSTRDEQTTEHQVTHVYDATGSYTARVTVFDADGNRARATVAVNVTDTVAPNVALSAPSQRQVGTDVPALLDASASSDNHAIATYRWDFGADGTTDRHTPDPTTRYRFEGESPWRVRVIAVDAAGNENATTFRFERVRGPPPTIGVEPRGQVVVGQTAFLRATVTGTDAVPNVTWRFPDGTIKSGRTVGHTFDSNGTNQVGLVADFDNGVRVRRNVSLTVQDGYTDGVGDGFGLLAGFGAAALWTLFLLGRKRGDS